MTLASSLHNTSRASPESTESTEGIARAIAAVAPRGEFAGRYFLVAAAATLVLLVICSLTYVVGSRLLLQAAARMVHSISELKAGEVATWLETREDNAALLYGHLPLVQRLVSPQGAGLTDKDKADREALWYFLDKLQKSYGYSGIAVYDAEGNTLFQIGQKGVFPTSEKLQAYRLVCNAQTALESVISVDHLFAPDDPTKYFHTVSVCSHPKAEGSEGGKHLMLSMTTTLENEFFTNAFIWPGDDKHGEIILIKKDETTITHVHAGSSSPALEATRVPYGLGTIPTSAKDGFNTKGENFVITDYRNIELVGTVHPIARFPYALVAQIPKKKLLQEQTALAWVAGSLAAGGMLICALLLTYLYRAQIRRTTALTDSNLELRQMRMRAESMFRATNAFLANTSHEIRTPLNAIMGATFLVSQRGTTDAWTTAKLGMIEDASRHLLSVINDILDVARIESGKMSLEEIEFDLEQVLEHNVLNLLEAQAKAKGLELVCVIDPEALGSLIGDPVRIAQAVLNYLSNAIKFTQTGRVSVRARATAGNDADSLTLRIEVVDTGIGLTPEQISRLFQAFEQADGSTTRKHGGFGLGLVINQHLAHLMHGDVGVESVPEAGSLFWITMQVRRSKASGRTRRTVFHGRRVLVVDDLSDAREAHTAMLEKLGVRVDSAESGPAALSMIALADGRGEPYEAVLLDWRMPEMNGLETLRQIQGLALDNPIPAIAIVTAHDSQSLREQTQGASISQVLTKPMTPSSMHDALQTILAPLAAPPATTKSTTHAADTRARAWLAHQNLRASKTEAKVLIVEDNPVNREVLVELLQDLGLTIDLAENGLQAVNLAKKRHYDLVLMDMQMPEMDGLQATIEIRMLDGWLNTPIIAMTANVSVDDKTRCLAAGMNAHLAKPVEPYILYRTLSSWLSHAGSVPGPASAMPAEALRATDDDAPVDIAFLQDMISQKPQVLHRVLRQVVDHHADDKRALLEAVYLQNWDQAFRIAHALKGMSGQIGARALQAAAADAETYWRAGAEAPPSLVVDLCDKLTRLLVEVQRLLTEGLAAVSEPVEHTQAGLRQQLGELQQMLKSADARAINQAESLGDTLAKVLPTDLKQVAAQMLGCVDRFDFNEASQHLQIILDHVETPQ